MEEEIETPKELEKCEEHGITSAGPCPNCDSAKCNKANLELNTNGGKK